MVPVAIAFGSCRFSEYTEKPTMASALKDRAYVTSMVTATTSPSRNTKYSKIYRKKSTGLPVFGTLVGMPSLVVSTCSPQTRRKTKATIKSFLNSID